MKMRISAFLLTLVAAAPALAAPQPVPLRGQVEAFAPGSLEVLVRSGEKIAVTVPPDLQIVSILPRKVADIAVGDAVSTTAVPDGKGGLTAIQVSILPAALAGKNEGQRPWDVQPDSVMTNATISGVAVGAGGGEITLQFGGKSIRMTVPEDVPVIAFGPGDAGLLKPGADVFIIAMKADDGTFSTNRVIAESNGIKPPM